MGNHGMNPMHPGMMPPGAGGAPMNNGGGNGIGPQGMGPGPVQGGRTSDSEEFKGDAAMGGNGGHQHWRLMTGGVMSSRNHQGQDLLIRCRGMLRCTQVL